MSHFACSPDLQARAKAVGLDLSKLDWSKIAQIVKLLVELFSGPVNQQSVKAAHPDCPDNVCECCCANVCDGLKIVERSLECCSTCKP